MKQVNADRVLDALATLAVLRAMAEVAPASDGCFDDVLLRLHTLLEQSIAANDDITAEG